MGSNRAEGIGSMKERTCPICKKRFIVRGEWGWTEGKKFYCRYNCMAEARRQKRRTAEEKKRAKRLKASQASAAAEKRADETGNARTLDGIRAEMVRMRARPSDIRAARLIL